MQPAPHRIFTEIADGKKAKQLEKAKIACRAALRAKPYDIGCMHALGLIESQLGNAAAAKQWFEKALALQPDMPDLNCHYGLALMEEGKYADAAAFFRRVLALVPQNLEALYHLATALAESAQMEEATATYRHVLALKPDYPEALNGFGNLLYLRGKLAEAIDCYRRALTARPTYIMAYNNMGLALAAIGELNAADAHYRQAIKLNPDYAEAHNNLGVAGMMRGAFDDSIACYEKALSLRPHYHEAHNNLGNVLKEYARPDEAIAHYEKALRRKNTPDYIHNLALAQLMIGDFDKGWRGYEARWQTQQMASSVRAFPQPQWRGEDGGGRALLIHAEQGFGDTLQFCRYAPQVKARGFASVILEVQPGLETIIGSLQGVDHVVAEGQTLPAFDLHCPMLSLPLAFGTRLDTIPANIPYLSADPHMVEKWRRRMPEKGGKLRVGLVWAGNARWHTPDLIAADRRRSLNPELFMPLLDAPDAQFYSLQKSGPPAPESFGLIDFMGACETFADTAALIANLDLVISVDTAVAHLAGALGKQVWLLNRFGGCWRWLQQREDSPWYPTLRLFRQTQPGNWEEVLARVKRELTALLL